MFCPHCHEDNPADAVFCGNCGEELPLLTRSVSLPFDKRLKIALASPLSLVMAIILSAVCVIEFVDTIDSLRSVFDFTDLMVASTRGVLMVLPFLSLLFNGIAMVLLIVGIWYAIMGGFTDLSHVKRGCTLLQIGIGVRCISLVVTLLDLYFEVAARTQFLLWFSVDERDRMVLVLTVYTVVIVLFFVFLCTLYELCSQVKRNVRAVADPTAGRVRAGGMVAAVLSFAIAVLLLTGIVCNKNSDANVAVYMLLFLCLSIGAFSLHYRSVTKSIASTDTREDFDIEKEEDELLFDDNDEYDDD